MKHLRLIAFGLFAGFLAAELGLRLFTPDGFWRHFDTASPLQSGRWVSHPFLPYAGGPDKEVVLKNDDQGIERIVTNSYGFRAHEFVEEKADGDYIILCFGGSTTYGYRVESNELTWPELLEARLSERYPDRNVRAFNMGLDMATTAMSVVNMGLVGVHLEPDLVIVYHGYNDLAAIGASNHRTDHAHFYGDLHAESVRRGYQSAVPGFLRNSYVVHLATGALDRRGGVNDLAREVQRERFSDTDRFKGMESTLQNLATVGAMADGAGADTLYSTFQFADGQNPTYLEFNERLRAFFDEEGLDYVDQAALLPDNDPAINVDACHFTGEGRERLVENFHDRIVELGLLD